MVKKSRFVIMTIGKYRIVKKSEGVYRLQYKKKMSLYDLARRKDPWGTIPIDFTDITRLKVKMYTYELNMINNIKVGKQNAKKMKRN